MISPRKFGPTLLLALVLASLLATPTQADGPRVLAEGKLPEDWRLGALKDYDGYFPFTPVRDENEWAKRSEYVRRQLKVALGIWPEPERTPLNPVIHGKVEREGYTVEKVYFEAVPGFFVTGSLYRPAGKEGKHPGILCPHGHWNDGRFYDTGEDQVKKDIAAGAEKFEEGGRSPLQARCATLARLGCVVFHYDMAGYADSTQLSFELVHRFGKQRPEANDAKNWGFFSPQAESHLQSVMGLQIWSGIRAIDFLESLPDVDATRLGVTGASGGGTQTMLLGAVDPRLAAIVPAVMVSTSMQGGCTCENCSLLRVGTGNIEFAALFAPKPQLVINANDWTKEMETKGFPELREQYKLAGAEQNVAMNNHLEFGHNYNYVNRAAMYGFFNEHLKLGHEEPIVEGDYKRLSKDELSVWDDAHPRPAGGLEYEKELTALLREDARAKLLDLVPTDEASLAKFKEVVGGGIDVVIGRGLPNHEKIEYVQSVKNDEGDFLEMAGVLNYKTPDDKQEQIPISFLYPKEWNKQVVIWISPQGKAGLYDEDGPIAEPVKQLMREGVCVIGADLFAQGEFLADGKPLEQTPKVPNPREAPCYTYGYNNAVFARRVHDILTVVAYVKHHGLSPSEVVVAGFDGEAGPLVAAARAQAQGAIDRIAVDTHGFRFGDVNDWQSPNFLPGGAKYFDLPGMLAVAAPAKAWIAGEKEGVLPLASAYKVGEGRANLLVHIGQKNESPAEVVDAGVKWIVNTK